MHRIEGGQLTGYDTAPVVGLQSSGEMAEAIDLDAAETGGENCLAGEPNGGDGEGGQEMCHGKRKQPKLALVERRKMPAGNKHHAILFIPFPIALHL